MTTKQQNAALQKLKKQAIALKRKEKLTQLKLRATMAKVHKIVKSYESKLKKQSQETKTRIAAAEAAIYAKLVKLMQEKAKVKSVISKVTKTHKRSGKNKPI